MLHRLHAHQKTPDTITPRSTTQKPTTQPHLQQRQPREELQGQIGGSKGGAAPHLTSAQDGAQRAAAGSRLGHG